MIAAIRKYKLTNFSLIIALFLVLGCGKDKTHPPAKVYHNTTSYFNGYYNANLLFQETLDQIEEAYQFPEAGFLEVINYGSEDEIKSYIGQFDQIVEKNDVVIFKHPNGNYIDNCRLLNGKAWFYKQNYTLAMQNFDEVVDKYPESKLIPDAHIWRAKAFYMLDNKEQAKSILDEEILFNDTVVLSKKQSTDLAIFRSRLEIEGENYGLAATLLEEHVSDISNRRRKSRAHFLLGQLYDEVNDFPKSLEHYSEVAKYSNDYDFGFKSKMKVARLYVDYQEGQDDDRKVYDYLNKLLKDEKNEEYRDQIYYEFALLEVKKDSLFAALDYLRESIATNVSNQRQKALSYYKSGQIYFYDLTDYTNAQAYFDSAAQVITQTAPEYKEITDLAKTLKDYVTQLETIHYQDSMLWLESLSDSELKAIVDSIVADEERRIQEQKEKEQAELLKQQQGNFTNPALLNQTTRRNNGRNQGGGTWYFDNPAAVTNGRLQFQQRWKPRPNEDNWRRSKKGISSGFSASEEDSTIAEAVDSTLLKQYGDQYQYYKDIPKTAEEVQAAKDKIELAMYKLGQIYSQKLNEMDSAVKTYEALLDRFENTEYTLRTRYALYKLYREMGSPLAEVQKNLIVNEYPNTVYAYLIQGKDPKELKKDEEEYLYAYDGLFVAYNNREYETSLGFSNFLLQEYTEKSNLDLAKLHYIRGMSYGYTGQKDSLRSILTYVVETFPESDVTPPAKKTLELMNTGIASSKQNKPAASLQNSLPAAGGDANLSDPNNEKYKDFVAELKPNDKVFVLMFIDKKKLTKAEANTKISNFNQQFYKDNKLKVFVFLYKQTHLVPYVNRFETLEAAEKYANDFKESDIGKEVLVGNGAEVFFITHTNFKVAYGKKRMTDYIDYYKYILQK